MFTHTLVHSPFQANSASHDMLESRSDFRRFLLPAILLLAAFAAFSVDLPVAMQIKLWTDKASPEYSRNLDIVLKGLNRFETFGHGFGVVIVLILLHQLDPSRRWALPRVIACSFGAGLGANLVKLLLARMRPYELTLTFQGSAWDTFRQWLPPIDGPCGLQSFPSAHTATAVGLAAALIWLYPQGRFLFTLLAVLVGCQRIASQAHFTSDVLIGAAVGSIVATFVLYVGRLPKLFDRWEARWRGEQSN
jgi:membrane-associated phospholipid phosphatase